jgi:predicted HicB family RNase H-like nuclease
MDTRIAQVVPAQPGQEVYQPGYKHKIHVRIDDDLHKRLRAYVAEKGLTVQSFLEGLIRQTVG